MEDNRTFTEGKIFAPLVRFMLPVLLALFLQTLYGAVDLWVVGKFAESFDVSAVSTGSQLMSPPSSKVSERVSAICSSSRESASSPNAEIRGMEGVI